MKYKNRIYLSAFITIILVSMLVLPFLIPKSAEVINTVFSFLREYIVYWFSIIEILIATVQFIYSKVKKEKFSNIVFKMLVTCLIFSVPFSIPFAGNALSEKYEEIAIEINKSQNNPSDGEGISVTETTEAVSSQPIDFTVSFEDLKFTKKSVSLLTQYKDIYTNAFYAELISNNEDNATTDKGYPIEFEECVARACDLEKTYAFIYNNNLFTNNDRNIRYEFLQKAIELREKANSHFCNSENQRLIACRYNELATEYFRDNKRTSEIDCYLKSIKWNINSFQTLYKSQNNNIENQNKIITEIIVCYSELEKLEIENNSGKHTEQSERYRILKEIFEEIKEDYILKYDDC